MHTISRLSQLAFATSSSDLVKLFNIIAQRWGMQWFFLLCLWLNSTSTAHQHISWRDSTAVQPTVTTCSTSPETTARVRLAKSIVCLHENTIQTIVNRAMSPSLKRWRMPTKSWRTMRHERITITCSTTLRPTIRTIIVTTVERDPRSTFDWCCCLQSQLFLQCNTLWRNLAMTKL